MKKSQIIELIIFLVLLSILIILGVKIFKHTFDIGEAYHLQFSDINGIEIGSPVRMLGVDIGHVTKIKPEANVINVDFIINDEKIKIPSGTSATIESFGLGGSRSIELSPPATPVDNYTKEIATNEPIRLGHAFNIVKDFLRASMATIGGLYEFAKNRTQGDAEDITRHAVNSTIEADGKIINLTNRIQKAGNTTQGNIQRTTKGMDRIYRETSVFNVAENINVTRYVINVSKRSLIKFHRDIKTYSPVVEQYATQTNSECQKIKNMECKNLTIDRLYETSKNLDCSLEKINSCATEDNLNKWEARTNKWKNFTQKMNNSF